MTKFNLTKWEKPKKSDECDGFNVKFDWNEMLLIVTKHNSAVQVCTIDSKSLNWNWEEITFTLLDGRSIKSDEVLFYSRINLNKSEES